MLTLAKLKLVNEVLPTFVESVKLKAEIDRAIRNINEVLNEQ